MHNFTAPATVSAATFNKVNGSAAVREYVNAFNNAKYISRNFAAGTGYIVRAADNAIKAMVREAGFAADIIEVHDASMGDATWHIYRPAGIRLV